MLDAVRYVVDNSIKWRSVPADFPAWAGFTRSSGAGAARAWTWSSRPAAGRSPRQ
ncbi:hypothetical protein ACF05T_26475 [Streptomyces lateritius]|uniref:Transposase n=1 Tax=Streptomyces lateritius TaxID=67313 RepID=A0ABW6YID5_9ACTN